jgi:hypothetical protein
MSTVDKDFKIRNGISVNGNAVIGGSVTVSAPTANSHVATKSYVDTTALPAVSDTAPESPIAGKLWLDTISTRLHIFDGTDWMVLATIEDANVLQDHIHDTSIEGDGRIVSIFIEGGSPTSTYYFTYDAGNASTTDWADTWSGGVATDSFN